ncbi:MAG: DUF3347 domain-containing protein [Bacteroidota bacterium]
MVRLVLLPLLMGGLIGCAPTASVAFPDDHPAHPEAPTAPFVATATLAPFDAAFSPATLGTSEGDTLLVLTPEGEAALRAALTAYLAIAERLAADQADSLATPASTFAAALDALTNTEAVGRPHAWHERAQAFATIRTHAEALAIAPDLGAARAAFGQLSLSFADLVAATGAPGGFTLTRFVCGMADAPGGGVWLQADESPRNPYFGSAMLMCHRSKAPVPDNVGLLESPGHDEGQP